MTTTIKSSIIMIIMGEVLLWLGNAKSSKTSRLSLQTLIQWSPNTINAKSILNWKILLHDKKHPQHCKWLPSLDHDWNGLGIDGTSGSWTRLRIENFLWSLITNSMSAVEFALLHHHYHYCQDLLSKVKSGGFWRATILQQAGRFCGKDILHVHIINSLYFKFHYVAWNLCWISL